MNNRIEHLEKLIEITKELIDHAMTIERTTGYKKDKLNYSYIALVRQEAEKELILIKRWG